MVMFGFFDADAGLALVLGMNDLATFCAGGMATDMMSFQEVILPGDPGLRRWVRQMKGDNVGAIVWSPPSWPFPICAYDPLAVGTANVVRTDNDVFAGSQDNNNSNAYGFKANGTLVGTDGQVYRLNFVFRAVWDGEDRESQKEVLKIQLTPTGN